MTITRPAPSLSGRTIPLDEIPRLEPDRTLTIDERLTPVERSASLVNRSWVLRSDSNNLHAEIIDGHTELVVEQLEANAQERAKAGTTALLAELADHGFAWVDIARLVGVSVPAIRKWRTGGAASSEKLLELTRVVALVDWLRDDKLIADVASWLEVPLSPSAPLTRMDLLQRGAHDLVIRSLVGDGLTPAAVLDEFEPGWRESYSSDFEVFTAGDGQRSIRPKQAEHR